MAPITIDGNKVSAITIDGTDVKKVTADGDVVWTAIPDSATHRWPMDTGSGSTVYDSIGSDNGSFKKSPSWVSDSNAIGGYMIDFDSGSNDRIQYGKTFSDFSLSSSWSFAITIDADDASTSGQVIMHQAISGGDVSMSLEGGVVAGAMWNGSNTVAPAEKSITGNTKQRVVYVYDDPNNTSTIYVNASGSSSGGQVRYGNSSNFALAAKSNGDLPFNGSLDDAIIANEAWSSSTVQDDYDRQPWS